MLIAMLWYGQCRPVMLLVFLSSNIRKQTYFYFINYLVSIFLKQQEMV